MGARELKAWGPRICSPVTLFIGMGIENGKNGLG
jgi:hypothetical protein